MNLDSIKILAIVGARPQFIKLAPLYAAAKKTKQINLQVLHTGQHYDNNMSEIFFSELGMEKPKFSLNIQKPTHCAAVGSMLIECEKVALEYKPDFILVFGDTDSTLAGALCAALLHICLIHIESGLRSNNFAMPEEINRILSDRASSLLFAASKESCVNLIKEGFICKDFIESANKFDLNSLDFGKKIDGENFPNIAGKGKIRVVYSGDIMYDCFLHFSSKTKMPNEIAKAIESNQKICDFVLATIHRAENTDDFSRLGSIFSAFLELSKERVVICPLHPRTKNAFIKSKICEDFLSLDSIDIALKNNKGLVFIAPCGYLEMLWLLKNCSLVLSDSGGVQKEAYFSGVPCVILREQSEWGELVEIGAAKIAGVKKDDILKAVKEFDKKIIFARNLYGDGKCAEIILREILAFAREFK